MPPTPTKSLQHPLFWTSSGLSVRQSVHAERPSFYAVSSAALTYPIVHIQKITQLFLHYILPDVYHISDVSLLYIITQYNPLISLTLRGSLMILFGGTGLLIDIIKLLPHSRKIIRLLRKHAARQSSHFHDDLTLKLTCSLCVLKMSTVCPQYDLLGKFLSLRR